MAPKDLHGVAPILEGVELRQGGEPQATQASHIPTLAKAQGQEQTRSTKARLPAPDQSTGLEAAQWEEKAQLWSHPDFSPSCQVHLLPGCPKKGSGKTER